MRLYFCPFSSSSSTQQGHRLEPGPARGFFLFSLFQGQALGFCRALRDHLNGNHLLHLHSLSSNDVKVSGGRVFGSGTSVITRAPLPCSYAGKRSRITPLSHKRTLRLHKDSCTDVCESGRSASFPVNSDVSLACVWDIKCLGTLWQSPLCHQSPPPRLLDTITHSCLIGIWGSRAWSTVAASPWSGGPVFAKLWLSWYHALLLSYLLT